ncbi:MAG: hypothetical protein RLZZ475_1430, partial [Pseudomonadota bacterium]
MSQNRSIARPALVAATALFGLAAGVVAAPGAARSPTETSISLRDTFPIGSNGLCEAQILAPEPGAGLFDRRYSIICRDAATPVGTLWVVKGKDADVAPARFAGQDATCNPGSGGAEVPGLTGAQR